MGIGSAAAAGLIKSATIVDREQRSALPNQVSKMNLYGCVNQASNDLHIGSHLILFFTLTCGDNNCILLVAGN